MNEKFVFGVVLGMVGGAILATNSAKTRQLVRDGQDEVQKRVEEMAKPKKSNKSK